MAEPWRRTWASTLVLTLLGCGSGSIGSDGSSSPDAIATPDGDSGPVCLVAGEQVSPGRLSSAFQSVCAGCHGASGQGVGTIPAVPGRLSAAEYRQRVREGKGGKMPAFDVSHISDRAIYEDYATLTGQQVQAPSGLDCVETDPNWTPGRIQEAITVGMLSFRKEGAHREACASCHGMLPMDLAIGGYPDGTIIRRALLHVPEEDALRIVDLVHALRAKYGLENRDRAMAFRPFQPGGVPLSAASPAEGDHLFGVQLAEAAPALNGPPINELAKALEARDQLLRINARTFPVALELNRWTEDSFHGGEHASIADWIPTAPHLPKDDAAKAQLYALHNAYLADPSQDNLLKILKETPALTEVIGEDAQVPSQFSHLKFQSVLLAQHEFMMRALKRPTLEARGAHPYGTIVNPVWSLADLMRSNEGPVHACTQVRGCLGFSAETTDGIGPQASMESEFLRIKESWFYAGWLFDTTLYRSGASNATTSSEYFTAHLYSLKYLNHLTFVRLRKNLAVAYDPDGNAEEGDVQRIAHAQAQNYGYFLAYGRGTSPASLPPEGAPRELYTRLLANGIRMMFRLVLDDVTRSRSGHGLEALKELPKSEIAQFLGFANGVDLIAPSEPLSGQAAIDRRLIDDVEAALGSACESKPLAYKQAPYPGHCTYQGL